MRHTRPSKYYQELLTTIELDDEDISLSQIVLLLIGDDKGIFFMYMCIVFMYISLQFLCDLLGKWLSLNLITFDSVLLVHYCVFFCILVYIDLFPRWLKFLF